MKISGYVYCTVLLILTSTICHAENWGLDDIAAPITHPTVFEDPRPYTEARPIYIYHKIDDKFVTSGGAANIYALQLRYAIDDRWGIIATKDGFVDLNSDAVLDDQHGFADIALGAKYAFYRDDAERQIATLGLRYEIPTGEKEVFQGQGDGAFNPFMSAAAGFGAFNFMAGTGFRIALDDQDSSFYDAALHIDVDLGILQPVIEFNLVHALSSGERLPIADEGEDFFNFGSSEADGKTLVSGSFGVRANLTYKIIFGAAYQIPLSDGKGSNILDYRVTTDLIFKL